MERKRTLRISLFSALIAASLVRGHELARAQEDSASADTTRAVHATLFDWNQRMWLTILDRSGSAFGRTSERGILQRFNERMDFEYHIDLVSYRFSLTETYDWYRGDSGARSWAGSINHLYLMGAANFKASVPLGDTWWVQAQYVRDDDLEADRSLGWLQFNKGFSENRYQAFALTTLQSNKAEIDFEGGFTFSPGPGHVTVAIAALDVFSNTIYKKLEVPASIADTAIEYSKRPLAARLALDFTVGRGLRVEAYALGLTPTQVVVESQREPGNGFTQDERYAYTGGLLEWTPSAQIAIGGMGTWVRARTDRMPLAAGPPEDDFDLTEITSSLGVYGIHRFSSRFDLELWLARVWRSEVRSRPDTTVAPGIDYRDRSWASRTTLTYTANSGFRADLGLDFLVRAITQPDAVPGLGALDRDNFRLRFGLGWRLDRRALFLLGSNVDLDDRRESGFDGAYGRFALYW